MTPVILPVPFSFFLSLAFHGYFPPPTTLSCLSRLHAGCGFTFLPATEASHSSFLRNSKQTVCTRLLLVSIWWSSLWSGWDLQSTFCHWKDSSRERCHHLRLNCAWVNCTWLSLGGKTVLTISITVPFTEPVFEEAHLAVQLWGQAGGVCCD